MTCTGWLPESVTATLFFAVAAAVAVAAAAAAVAAVYHLAVAVAAAVVAAAVAAVAVAAVVADYHLAAFCNLFWRPSSPGSICNQHFVAYRSYTSVANVASKRFVVS